MLRNGVGGRFQPDADMVVDVPPMVRRCVGRIEAERVHGVDGLKYALDFGPVLDLEQDIAARPHEGQRLIGVAVIDG